MRFLFGTMFLLRCSWTNKPQLCGVVDKLIVPSILGVDFLQGNGLTLDFSPLKVEATTVKQRSAFPKRQGRQGYHSWSILNKITQIVCLH